MKRQCLKLGYLSAAALIACGNSAMALESNKNLESNANQESKNAALDSSFFHPPQIASVAGAESGANTQAFPKQIFKNRRQLNCSRYRP